MDEIEIPCFPNDWQQIRCVAEVNFQSQVPPGGCFRLILTVTGAGIVTIGEQRFAFTSPTLFCLNEQESVALVTSGTIETNEFHFHPDWLHQDSSFINLRTPGFFSDHGRKNQDLYLLLPFLDRSAGYRGHLQCTPETLLGLRNAFNATRNQLTGRPDQFWPYRSRSYLLQALIMVFDVYTMGGAEPAASPVEEKGWLRSDTDQTINEVIAYLHNHYAEEIQIAFLERRFGLNRTTLAERFKEATGQSIMSYLRGLRLKTAASLLQETYVPVGEICERVGFGDLSHFGRVFKEEFSLTPKEYRDRFCWMYRN